MTRAEQELDTLVQISQILGDDLQLNEVFQRAMALLVDRLHIQRASLVVQEPGSDQFRTIASVGLTPAEQERGRYALGEGVTGKVLATGDMAVIPDVSRHGQFLNRTGSRAMDPAAAGAVPTSFICVPIKDADRWVGAVSFDKPFESDEQLAADARLLQVVAGAFAQAIRIHHLVQLEKDQWLEENQRLRDNLR